MRGVDNTLFALCGVAVRIPCVINSRTPKNNFDGLEAIPDAVTRRFVIARRMCILGTEHVANPGSWLHEMFQATTDGKPTPTEPQATRRTVLRSRSRIFSVGAAVLVLIPDASLDQSLIRRQLDADWYARVPIAQLWV